MDLVHITPRFAPQIDGVGDYARLLAIELKHAFRWESRFVIADPAWRAGKPIETIFPAQALTARDAPSLTAAIASADAIVLHYVSYGYHPRGVPGWVNRAIRQWKLRSTAASPKRLIIVFHELWASGPPWRSEFYLGPVQRLLIRELQSLSDGSLTSTPNMHRRLEALSPGKTAFAPIPSCVEPPPVALRRWHSGGAVTLVIFGQEASRRLTVAAHAPLIGALQAAGLLRELRVVGKGCVAGPTPSADVADLLKILPASKISPHRDLPPVQIAAILADSDLFLSYYPSEFLCKSSALTAAMACGCPPVLPETNKVAPLEVGVNILGCDGSTPAIDAIKRMIETCSIEPIGRAARAWYEETAAWGVTRDAAARHLNGTLP